MALSRDLATQYNTVRTTAAGLTPHLPRAPGFSTLKNRLACRSGVARVVALKAHRSAARMAPAG